jgi:long-chain acyl-CoA synthetase
MNSHGNVVFNSQAYREWCGLGHDDVVLGVAPLFHITGLIAHVTVSLLLGVPLVLFHRFEPSLAIDTVRTERPTFTVGSITVFIALMNVPGVERDSLASLTKIWSGGAPIPPSTVTAFSAAFGTYIHNIYGLTETTSPSHAVPFGADAPVDEASGALSVGAPLYDTMVRIVGDDGQDLPAGEIGELVTAGPQVVAGYWNKPEESAKALPGGALHTGDVGYMDQDGYVYLVDRVKDLILNGGFNVYPRMVEEAIVLHPAVEEATVCGVPDRHRGEIVKAYVKLRDGQRLTVAELRGFLRDKLAPFEQPKQIEFRHDLPRSWLGKPSRRTLIAEEMRRLNAEQPIALERPLASAVPQEGIL